MFEMCCTYKIIRSDATRLHLQSGRQNSTDIQITDPDLLWYKFLMENKLSLGDTDGFIYNARQYLLLADELVEQELRDKVEQFEMKINYIELFAVITGIGVLIMSLYHYGAFVFGSMFVCSLLIIVNKILFRRYSEFNCWINENKSTFEDRLNTFIRKECVRYRNKMVRNAKRREKDLY